MLRARLGRSAAASELISRDLDALLDGDYLGRSVWTAVAVDLRARFELSAQVARAYRRALERC